MLFSAVYSVILTHNLKVVTLPPFRGNAMELCVCWISWWWVWEWLWTRASAEGCYFRGICVVILSSWIWRLWNGFDLNLIGVEIRMVREGLCLGLLGPLDLPIRCICCYPELVWWYRYSLVVYYDIGFFASMVSVPVVPPPAELVAFTVIRSMFCQKWAIVLTVGLVLCV